MPLFKKKPAPQIRRQRHNTLEERPAKSMTYYSRRADQETKKKGRRKLFSGDQKPPVKSWARFWLQRFGLLALLIVLAVCAFSVLSLSSHANIVAIDDDDQTFFLHTADTYQVTADALLGQSIWNRNKITVSTADIEKQMQQKYPEISSISITLPLIGHRPIVYVETTRPTILLISAGTTYVIDNNGRALIKTNETGSLDNLGLPVVSDQSGIDTQVGKIALAKSSVDFIQTVIKQLEAKNQKVSTFTIPSGTNELDVQVAGQGYTVKFNLHDTNARRQVGAYLATQSWLSSKNVAPKYIDVRVEGRTYYQ